jgi:hypothetical protein
MRSAAEQAMRTAHLVSIQCALDELADLLKDSRLVGCGAKHFVKGEGVLGWCLASQATWHCDVNGTAHQLTCSTQQHQASKHVSANNHMLQAEPAVSMLMGAFAGLLAGISCTTPC